jgi:hypothetical protein
MTVRDEGELLRANLLYHHHLGVDLAFVYADGPLDEAAPVASLPFARVARSVGPERFAGRAGLAGAVARVDTHVTARQILNTCDAMERARAAGCAWLLALDADELACPDLDRGEHGALRTLLEAVPAGVACVRMPTLEVVQRAVVYGNVFAEAGLFKRDPRAIRRSVLDPRRGTLLAVRGFYGHTAGKSAVRVGAGAVPRTVHRFRGPGGRPLPTISTGHLLHYDSATFHSFARKYRRFRGHPDLHLWGAPIAPVKGLWRDVVNDPRFNEAELEAYYRRWVAFGDDEIARLRRSRWLGIVPRRPAVIEVTAPRQVFAALARSSAPALA